MPNYALSPQQALKFVEDGGVPRPADHILDFAAAGLAQAQALVMETVGADGQRDDASHADITTDLWKRIVREGQGDAVWGTGTVRLPGSDLVGGAPEVILTGIRFDAIGLVRILRYHLGGQGRREPTKAAARPKQEAAPAPAPVEAKGRKSRIPPPSSISLDGELLKVAEAQAVLRCGHSKLYALIKAGELEKRQTKAGVRITTKSVKAVLGITVEGVSQLAGLANGREVGDA